MTARTLALLAALLAGPAVAQIETREPPLADPNAPAPKMPVAGEQKPATAPPPAPPAVQVGEPVVALRLIGPSVSPINQPIKFTIVVENVSAAPAYSVAVRNTLPPGVQLVKATPEAKAEGNDLVWLVGKLDPRAKKEIAYTLAPPAAGGDVKQCARVVFEHGQCLTTRVSAPALAIKRTAPTEVQVGEPTAMKLEVSNTGQIDLDNLEINEPLPEGLEFLPDPAKLTGNAHARGWTIARLGAGQSRSVEYRVKATRPGDFRAVALAKSGGLKQQAESVVRAVPPKLELKLNGPARREAHLPARYTLTVRNAGIAAVQNVVLAHAVAEGCRVEPVTAGATNFGAIVQWSVPALAAGDTATVEFIARRDETGDVKQIVRASVAGIDERAEVATRFEAVPDVKWDVRLTPATVEVNGAVSLVVAVRNTGSAPATGTRLAVKLPRGLTFRRAEPTNYRQNAADVEFEPVTVRAGERQEYRLWLTATEPAVGAIVDARLKCDAFGTEPVIKQESVTVAGGGQTSAPSEPVPSNPGGGGPPR